MSKFSSGQIIIINTDTGFDEEGVCVSLRPGSYGIILPDQDKDSKFIQVQVDSDIGLCKLGIDSRFLNHMPKRIAELFAKQIADDLFINGIGDKATHLILSNESDKDLGGWCKDAVISRIIKHLIGEYALLLDR